MIVLHFYGGPLDGAELEGELTPETISAGCYFHTYDGDEEAVHRGWYAGLPGATFTRAPDVKLFYRLVHSVDTAAWYEFTGHGSFDSGEVSV